MPSDLRFSELYAARPHSSEDEDFHRHHPGCPHVFTCRVCGEETEATLSLLERAGRRPGFAHAVNCPVGLLEATGETGLLALMDLREHHEKAARRHEALTELARLAPDLRPAAFCAAVGQRRGVIVNGPEPTVRTSRTFRVDENETPAAMISAILPDLAPTPMLTRMPTRAERPRRPVWAAQIPQDVEDLLRAIPGVEFLPPGVDVEAWA